MRRQVIAAGLLLLFAMPLSGQTLAMHSPRPAPTPGELEAEAESLHDHPDEYRRAALLYLEAAMLRGIADAKAVHDQRMAARLLFYVGDAAHARSVMEGAGDQALALGDVVGAAHMFIDAAWIALRTGHIPEVFRLAERAELLMESPLVEADVRRAVMGRIRRDGDRLSVLPASL